MSLESNVKINLKIYIHNVNQEICLLKDVWGIHLAKLLSFKKIMVLNLHYDRFEVKVSNRTLNFVLKQFHFQFTIKIDSLPNRFVHCCLYTEMQSAFQFHASISAINLGILEHKVQKHPPVLLMHLIQSISSIICAHEQTQSKRNI